jgi:PAS domain S-box-containing protein
MAADRFFYLVPYFLSLGISLGILIHAWQHRKVNGARFYTWFMASQFLSVTGFILEILSPQLETKLLWDKFQWFTDGMFIILSFLLFTIQFTEHRLHRSKLFWSIVVAIPIIFNLLVVTDGIHHLIYPNPHLNNAYPYAELRYDFSALVYIFVFYVYLVPLYGMSLLINYALRVNRIYRWQAITIAIGFFIPLAFSVLALFGIALTPQRDATPFTFAFGNLVVVWGLFRYGTFEIIPIARERIVETMTDPVIVLDPNNRIVDVNSAALKFIGSPLSEIIGQASNRILALWPDLVELLKQPYELRQELTVKTEDDTQFFEINISNILNNNLELVGRIAILHDITRTKALEVSYRILSSELDQRVKERTTELKSSEARFRALFEDSPIPLLEENFSAVKKRIDELHHGGNADLRTFFLQHPETVREYLGLVQVTDINTAAMKWYAADSKDGLLGSLNALMNSDRSSEFMEELLLLLENRNHFEVNVNRLDREGNPIHLIINGNISTEHEDTWERVMVSILDITKLKQAEEELAIAYDTTLEGWAKALELKDKETEGHSRRVTAATVIVAREFGFKENELVDIRRGTILHDIGKMAIPDEILRKNGPLTLKEKRIVEKHPQVAYDLLKDIPHLKNAIDIPYCHHEKWDGSGYPRGLKGEEIPITARIFTIVDVWDALSSDRPYRSAWDKNKIVEYLQGESGRHFDPVIAAKFIELVSQGGI